MIEEGPDTFLQRWRPYAVTATLFARPEGSPLLEVEVGGVVLQLLERTNPYDGTPGRKLVLVQPTAPALALAEDAGPLLEVPARGVLRARGRVVLREGGVVVVDAGVPLLVDVPGLADGDGPGEGDAVAFEATPPIHGFVIPPDPQDGRPRDVDEAP